jgi:hypothetical protein
VKGAPRIVAVLEVMWGTPGRYRAFRINPLNASGARLIRLIGHNKFLVTNACPDGVMRATERGRPDAEWLRANLKALRPDVLLVCGTVAQATFAHDMAPRAKVLHMPHPAARNWSRQRLAAWRRRIQAALN